MEVCATQVAGCKFLSRPMITTVDNRGVIELVSVVFWNEVSVGMILQFVIELVSVVRGAP